MLEQEILALESDLLLGLSNLKIGIAVASEGNLASLSQTPCAAPVTNHSFILQYISPFLPFRHLSFARAATLSSAFLNRSR
jgi:hypothetical protein